jgi:hypothetical protein
VVPEDPVACCGVKTKYDDRATDHGGCTYNDPAAFPPDDGLIEERRRLETLYELERFDTAVQEQL